MTLPRFLGRVGALHAKPLQGGPMHPCGELILDPRSGVVGAAVTPPLRQVLLLSERTLRGGIPPGALRENVSIASDELDDLPSGTELSLGSARVRLTFHCEPCNRVRPWARPSDLLHRRGVLARVVEPGCVRTGDPVTVVAYSRDEVPYEPLARIAAFLRQRTQPILAVDLLWEVGLPRSYARALPALLRRLEPSDAQRVRFQNGRTAA